MMFRRSTSLFVVLSIMLAACSGEETIESTTTSAPSTTTTSAPSTTTTTLAPLSLEGAPAGLVQVVDGFYAYASGRSADPPAAPERVVAGINPSSGNTPTNGTAAVATFMDEGVAVVEVESDVFLAVEDEAGWRIVGGEWPSLSVAAFYGDGPRHLAVVGSDARPGEPVDRTRADSIHFVALDGEGGGAVVGLPRDSYVAVPGFGRQKILASLARGGPETMLAAFLELTGLPLEGYVLTGFAGFEELLSSVLGGVTVEVPFAINDRWAHVSLEAGVQLLDGAQALGFARARKTVPGGDFARSRHQGVILLGAARAVQAMGVSAIPTLLELSEPHLMTDLSAEQLLTFSTMVISADLDTVPNIVAPGSPGMAGSASVVYLSGSVAELWADLANGRLDDH
jgi:polyisoprenyl-teichoic acid--peptidoglycan teichoic acid transferase